MNMTLRAKRDDHPGIAADVPAAARKEFPGCRFRSREAPGGYGGTTVAPR
jgi:hypothetical protein